MKKIKLSVFWLCVGAVAYQVLEPRLYGIGEIIAVTAFFIAAALVDLGDA